MEKGGGVEYLSGEGDEIGNRSSCIATLIDLVFAPPTFVFNLFFPRRESFTVLSLRFDFDWNQREYCNLPLFFSMDYPMRCTGDDIGCSSC